MYWQKRPYDTVKEYAEFEEVKEEVPLIETPKHRLSKMSKEELIEFADKNGFNVKKSKSAENILAELIEQIDVKE